MASAAADDFYSRVPDIAPYARLGTGNGLIVFLHGLDQESRATWHLDDASESIPIRLSNDKAFDAFTILCLDWAASKAQKHWSLRSATDAVLRTLTEVFPELDWVNILVLVGHSYGGLVSADITQRIFRRESDEIHHFTSSVKVMLELIASPLGGSVYAKIGGRFSTANYLRSLDGEDDYVNMVVNEVKRQVYTAKHQRLHGREYVETDFYQEVRVLGKTIKVPAAIRSNAPRVVTQHSASALFPDPVQVQGADHSSITKWSKIGPSLMLDFRRISEIIERYTTDPTALSAWTDSVSVREYSLRREEFVASRKWILEKIRGYPRRLRYYVVVLDVDKCTQINRRLGPSATTRLLDKLAVYFSTLLGEQICRVGPDEFVGSMSAASKEDALLLLEAFCRKVRGDSENLFGCYLTVSCGFALIHQSEKPILNVLRAYKGCEKSKKAGSSVIEGPDRFRPNIYKEVVWEAFDRYDPKTLEERKHTRTFTEEISEDDAFGGFYL